MEASLFPWSSLFLLQLCKEFDVFIGGVLHDSNSFVTIVIEGDGRGNGVQGSLFQNRFHLLKGSELMSSFIK